MIFIEGNFPSFKNSKQRTAKGFMVMSKTVQKYLKANEDQWRDVPPEFSKIKEDDYPIFIGMHFVRGTRHKYDWINMCQGVQDLMVRHGWVEDDNTNIMYPVPLCVEGKYSSYDKENPGVYIKIVKRGSLSSELNYKRISKIS